MAQRRGGDSDGDNHNSFAVGGNLGVPEQKWRGADAHDQSDINDRRKTKIYMGRKSGRLYMVVRQDEGRRWECKSGHKNRWASGQNSKPRRPSSSLSTSRLHAPQDTRFAVLWPETITKGAHTRKLKHLRESGDLRLHAHNESATVHLPGEIHLERELVRDPCLVHRLQRVSRRGILS